jgi:hypothetical protein
MPYHDDAVAEGRGGESWGRLAGNRRAAPLVLWASPAAWGLVARRAASRPAIPTTSARGADGEHELASSLERHSDARGSAVMLATLASTPFHARAAELAVELALESAAGLIDVNVIDLPVGRTPRRDLGDGAAVARSLRAPAERAAALGAPVTTLLVRSLRRVATLLALVSDYAPAVIVFGPDPGQAVSAAASLASPVQTRRPAPGEANVVSALATRRGREPSQVTAAHLAPRAPPGLDPHCRRAARPGCRRVALTVGTGRTSPPPTDCHTPAATSRAGLAQIKEAVVRRFFPVAVALCALAASSVAEAAASDHSSFDITFTNTVTDICPFPVEVTSDLAVSQTNFFDANGTLVRSHFAVTETDVFRANGKTLTGLPYHSSLRAILDAAGNQLHAISSGVISRVPLPDGSTFLSAGRLDFIDHAGAQFLLTPDTGSSGNVTGFCGALAA